MGFATHLGPWLLGTVKNTTGTTAGTIRNMGNTSVGQTDAVSYNDAATSTACVLPAGSLITAITLIQSTKFAGTSGVITVYANGTAIATCAAITAGSNSNISFNPTSDAQGALWLNVGSTDAIITYTMASSGSLSAGAGSLLVEYLVRGSDGAANPTGTQA
jgi:hypothetical protein